MAICLLSQLISKKQFSAIVSVYQGITICFFRFAKPALVEVNAACFAPSIMTPFVWMGFSPSAKSKSLDWWGKEIWQSTTWAVR